MLPVYSVSDAEEARDLLVMACETNNRGEFIAKELVREQSLENLDAFGKRLNFMHDRHLVPKGNCRCIGRRTNWK